MINLPIADDFIVAKASSPICGLKDVQAGSPLLIA
jgi:hypothetical protein